MILYAKVINKETKKCEVGLATNQAVYQSLGFTPQDVEQSDIDGQWYLSSYAPMKTEEQKAQQEAERIAMLNLTGADVERAIYKAVGMDFDDIISLIEAQPLSETGKPIIDIKALKIELKANNFYRGSEWVNKIGNFLGFTSEQMDLFFEDGDYTHLLSE